jgi:hypothetical protein
MSAAEHQASAAREATEAKEHAEAERLAHHDESPYDGAGEHGGEAERHWQAAAEHGAAAETLMETEAVACKGVAALDRDTSPFEPRARIQSVAPIQELVRAKDAVLSETLGAAITLRPEPGLTGEELRRSVRCHVARAATLGHEMPGMKDCPLVLEGVEVSVVSSTGGPSTVRITSGDRATAHEIVRRAEALVGRRRSHEPIPSW